MLVPIPRLCPNPHPLGNGILLSDQGRGDIGRAVNFCAPPGGGGVSFRPASSFPPAHVLVHEGRWEGTGSASPTCPSCSSVALRKARTPSRGILGASSSFALKYFPSPLSRTLCRPLFLGRGLSRVLLLLPNDSFIVLCKSAASYFVPLIVFPPLRRSSSPIRLRWPFESNY